MKCQPFIEYFEEVNRQCWTCANLCCRGEAAIIHCYNKCNPYYNKCMTLSPPNGAVYEVNGTPTHNYTKATCNKDCSNTTSTTKSFTDFSTSVSPATSFFNDSFTNFTTGIFIPQSDSNTFSSLIPLWASIIVGLVVIIVIISAVIVRCWKKNKFFSMPLSYSVSDETTTVNVETHGFHQATAEDVIRHEDQLLPQNPQTQKTSSKNTFHTSEEKTQLLLNICDDDPECEPRTCQPEQNFDENETPLKSVIYPGIEPRTHQPEQNFDENETPLKSVIYPGIEPRTHQPEPNYDENETPLKSVKYPGIEPRTRQPEPNYDENETTLKSVVHAKGNEVVAYCPIETKTSDKGVETPSEKPEQKLELRENTKGNGKGRQPLSRHTSQDKFQPLSRHTSQERFQPLSRHTSQEGFQPLSRHTSRQKSQPQSLRTSIESLVIDCREDATKPPTSNEHNELDSNDATNDGATPEKSSATNPGSLSKPYQLSLSEKHEAGDRVGDGAGDGASDGASDRAGDGAGDKAGGQDTTTERHLLSLRVSLLPVEWKKAECRLDKFEVTHVLDDIPWVVQYMLDEERIDIYVEFGRRPNLTYLNAIEMLKWLTQWEEIDFRMYEMTRSEFKPFGGGQGPGHGMGQGQGQGKGRSVISPGAEITIKSPEKGQRIAAIGTILHCKEEGKYYAATAGHCIREGEPCYVTGQKLGTCVFKYTNMLRLPYSIDIALIEIDMQRFELENLVMSATGDRCGFRLPANQQEVCDMECWKVQRKSRDTWQYGFLRYALLTNKAEVLHRVIAVVRTAPEVPVISEGDCGSLVTSLPRPGEVITAYGMFTGRLTLQALDGSDEPNEWYVALPFDQTLEFLRSHERFRGKSLEIVDKDDNGH